jgi:hypothetical protein
MAVEVVAMILLATTLDVDIHHDIVTLAAVDVAAADVAEVVNAVEVDVVAAVVLRNSFYMYEAHYRPSASNTYILLVLCTH